MSERVTPEELRALAHDAGIENRPFLTELAGALDCAADTIEDDQRTIERLTAGNNAMRALLADVEKR